MLVLLLAVVMFLAGCGQSDEDKAKDAAVGFYSALAAGDGQRACGYLTVTEQRQLAGTGDDAKAAAACEKELTGVFGPSVPKSPRADSVDIHGTEAVVEVSGERGVHARIRLKKSDGAWKVSDF